MVKLWKSSAVIGTSFSSRQQRAVVKIGVGPSLTYYFSLFLEEEEETGDGWTCGSPLSPSDILFT